MRLPEQSRILTAIVGSYPKPHYVYPESGKALLDTFGTGLDKPRAQLGDKEFDALLDRAALEAISDQEHAGIDILTDGEERRAHYVIDIVSKLSGVDSEHLKHISIRNGTAERDTPVVTGKIGYKGPIVIDEFRFAKKHANSIVKISLPGPMTAADCIADEFYGDKKRLAFDYAAAIRDEVEALIAAGCSVIQFDDPVLLRYPQDAREWGLDALQACFSGFEDKACFIVHICRGYPDKPLESQGVQYKANSDYYKDILSWLSKSNLDAVSIEGAQGNLDLSVLEAIGDKTVMLGVLDVGDEAVESVEHLVKRGNEALKRLPKEQLIFAPDCGMLEISRESAKSKLANLVEATRQLNETV